MTAIIVALITTSGVIAAALISRAAVLQAAREAKPSSAPLTREESLKLWAEHVAVIHAIVTEGERARKVRELPQPSMTDTAADQDELRTG